VTDDRADDASLAQFAEGFLLTADTMAWFGNGYCATPGDLRADPLYNDHAQTQPTVLEHDAIRKNRIML
jgi:acetyl esterase